MALWGNSTTAENRPKWLGGDGSQGAGGAKEDAFATDAGWALRAGTIASGNDNASAQAEVLVCIGGLSATVGAANLLSLDFTEGAVANGGTFDLVLTFDEAMTVTSAAWTTDNVITNKIYISLTHLGGTDMIYDGLDFHCMYYSGSGTNKITLRGVSHSPGNPGYIQQVSGGFNLVFNGSAAMVDGNGTAFTTKILRGGSANCGADSSTALVGTAIVKTGSAVNTMTTTVGYADFPVLTGSTSGSEDILTGVTTTT